MPAMSIQALGHKFVEMCNQGKNFDVMEAMYAPDIVSVEGDGKEWKGKGPVIQKSRDWAKGVDFRGEKALGPYFNGGNQFAVHFSLDITRKATGESMTLQEVALYTVNKDGLISREQFFYEGDH
jgi:ketosteroid isomerase-like protein